MCTGWTGVGLVLDWVGPVLDWCWTGVGLTSRGWTGVGPSSYHDLHVGRVGPVLDRCWTADVLE